MKLYHGSKDVPKLGTSNSDLGPCSTASSNIILLGRRSQEGVPWKGHMLGGSWDLVATMSLQVQGDGLRL